MKDMRQWVFGVLVAASFLASAFPAQAQDCVSSTPLIAGQSFDAGTVSVSSNDSFILVQFMTVGPWVMSDAHVAVADSLAAIPQTKNGNPIPGRFPYAATFDPEVQNYTFVIPAGAFAPGQPLYIAAHAMVHAPKSFGGSQTGWGAGMDFPGANWATYLTYRRCSNSPE